MTIDRPQQHAELQWQYRAYGLSVHANRPIAGLLPDSASASANVQIWFGQESPGWQHFQQTQGELIHISPYQDEDNNPILHVWRLDGGAFIRFTLQQGIQLVVEQSGHRVWVVWPAANNLEDAAALLIHGFILGFVLRLRGTVLLHASAVAVDGHAIALVGPSGAGKSTTAMALAQQGYPILSDDIVALEDQDHRFLVQPGYPRLRLWPDAARCLHDDGDPLPRLMSGWDKRYWDLAAHRRPFQSEALPLAAIYLLGQRHVESPRIEFVSPAQGLVALLADIHIPELVDPNRRLHEFEVMSRLVEHVPIRRLIAPAELTALPELCAAILEDSQAQIAGRPAYGGDPAT